MRQLHQAHKGVIVKFRETLLLTLIVASPELLAQASRGYAVEDGGRGGNAGDGGDGGDLTVLFTNEIGLKTVNSFLEVAVPAIAVEEPGVATVVRVEPMVTTATLLIHRISLST